MTNPTHAIAGPVANQPPHCASLALADGFWGLVACGGALCAVNWPEHTAEAARAKWPAMGIAARDDTLERAALQLLEYFSGARRAFDLPVAPALRSDFGLLVLRVCQQIPWGQTVSYGELADRIGRPTAARAVGAALARNPVPIFIPCHRVIGADGRLVGFGGGLQRKRALLEHEGIRVTAGNRVL